MLKKAKKYTEAELITQFHLKRVLGNDSPLMQEWLNAAISLNAGEQYLFDMIWTDAVNQIDGWQEEDLKMQFIAFVLKLGHLTRMKAISLILNVPSVPLLKIVF
jgi:hypothetical protein